MSREAPSGRAEGCRRVGIPCHRRVQLSEADRACHASPPTEPLGPDGQTRRCTAQRLAAAIAASGCDAVVGRRRLPTAKFPARHAIGGGSNRARRARSPMTRDVPRNLDAVSPRRGDRSAPRNRRDVCNTWLDPTGHVAASSHAGAAVARVSDEELPAPDPAAKRARPGSAPDPAGPAAVFGARWAGREAASSIGTVTGRLSGPARRASGTHSPPWLPARTRSPCVRSARAAGPTGVPPTPSRPPHELEIFAVCNARWDPELDQWQQPTTGAECQAARLRLAFAPGAAGIGSRTCAGSYPLANVTYRFDGGAGVRCRPWRISGIHGPRSRPPHHRSTRAAPLGLDRLERAP